MGNGSSPDHPASCLLAELPAAAEPQSTIPADAMDERKTTWGRHFRPSDRPAIADPKSHTPTGPILPDSHADLRPDSRRLWKNLWNHGLFAKKEKVGKKKERWTALWKSGKRDEAAFATFPQGLLPETNHQRKRPKNHAAFGRTPSALRALRSAPHPLPRYWIHSSTISSQIRW